ncbi:hypothetical protein FQN50_002664 [Emmonsiellopsis sp. PD_5]|nr:hypothetical protein FQN50_002664 [Emmonsiellopsis sp. PD_5]
MRAPTARLLRALRPSAGASPAAAVTGPATCLSRRCISSSLSSSSAPSRPITQNTPIHLSHNHPPPRPFSTTPTPSKKNAKPTPTTTPTPTNTPRAARNRPPVTTTDVPDDPSDSPLNSLNVFADIAAPTTAIDACLDDGFHLNNGVKVMGGDGCLLVDGEVFRWRPWEGGNNNKVGGRGGGGDKGGMGVMVNEKGQWDVSEEVWGVLKLVWPKPDLLILGLGGSVRPISPETRRHINLLGIRVEVQDTRNAAAQFNLLATERGVREVAAAMIPIGWRG